MPPVLAMSSRPRRCRPPSSTPPASGASVSTRGGWRRAAHCRPGTVVTVEVVRADCFDAGAFSSCSGCLTAAQPIPIPTMPSAWAGLRLPEARAPRAVRVELPVAQLHLPPDRLSARHRAARLERAAHRRLAATHDPHGLLRCRAAPRSAASRRRPQGAGRDSPRPRSGSLRPRPLRPPRRARPQTSRRAPAERGAAAEAARDHRHNMSHLASVFPLFPHSMLDSSHA